MSTVFAVFSTNDVNGAIELLGEYGYADNYKVIDRDNLRDMRLLGLLGRQANGGAGDTGVTGASKAGGAHDATAKGSSNRSHHARGGPEGNGAIEQVTHMRKMSEEVTEYLARSILDGACLIVVEVDSNYQAREVEELLKQAGAQSSNT